jgi:low temperature requirement protein LtrA
MFRKEADSRVSFAELFFDLVFVYAITQVSHYLLHNYSPRGAVEATLLFLALWWNWIYATWVLNRLDPEHLAVRGLLFVLMALGLYVSMALPEAFGDRALVFALGSVAMNMVRTLFVLVSGWSEPMTRRTYLRILVWIGLSAPFWIGGALAGGDLRLWLWIVALVIEYVAPALSFRVPGMGGDPTTNFPVNGGHMAERCALFVIICLGETLLVSGATFAEMTWTGEGHLAFLTSVAASIAMWWVYFNIGHRRGAHQIETSSDPERLARLGYTYAHLPIVAGVVLSAVACELAIAHPGDAATWGAAASLIGGPALFLAGNMWFKHLSAPVWPVSHLAGLILCAVTFVAAPALSLVTLSLVAAAILAAVAAWEHRIAPTAAHP